MSEDAVRFGGEKTITLRVLLAKGHTGAVASIMGQDRESVFRVALLLGVRDPLVRRNSAVALKEAAMAGVNIRPAILELGVALADKELDVQFSAGLALMEAAANTGIEAAVPWLVMSLGDGNEFVRSNAANALANAAGHHADISAAIPALGSALADRRMRAAAGRALANAAMDGADIGATIGQLRDALADGLKSGDGEAGAHVTHALSLAAEKNDMAAAVAVLGESLGDSNPSTQEYAARALELAAEKGADIRAAVGQLGKALEADEICAHVPWALGHAAAMGKSGDAPLETLSNALVDGRPGVRSGAVAGFMFAISGCGSAGSLDMLEARIQERRAALKERCGTQGGPAGTDSFCIVMNEIARKRDKLTARRDILLDNMPKAPKRGTVYQAARRSAYV